MFGVCAFPEIYSYKLMIKFLLFGLMKYFMGKFSLIYGKYITRILEKITSY